MYASKKKLNTVVSILGSSLIRILGMATANSTKEVSGINGKSAALNDILNT